MLLKICGSHLRCKVARWVEDIIISDLIWREEALLVSFFWSRGGPIEFSIPQCRELPSSMENMWLIMWWPHPLQIKDKYTVAD